MMQRRLGTGMGFADRRPPGQDSVLQVFARTGTHLHFEAGSHPQLFSHTRARSRRKSCCARGRGPALRLRHAGIPCIQVYCTLHSHTCSFMPLMSSRTLGLGCYLLHS